MLRVWVVEVIVLVLSLLLLCVKYLCEFPEIGLELFFVFVVYRHFVKHLSCVNFLVRSSSNNPFGIGWQFEEILLINSSVVTLVNSCFHLIINK